MIFVNADWSAIVPAGSPDAAFGVQPRDAKRLGVDKLPLHDGVRLSDLPEPTEPVVLRSAEPEEVMAAKEAPKPADKAAAKPANKAIRKPRSK